MEPNEICEHQRTSSQRPLGAGEFMENCLDVMEWGGTYRQNIKGKEWFAQYQMENPLDDLDALISDAEIEFARRLIKSYSNSLCTCPEHDLKDVMARFRFTAEILGGKDVIQHIVWREGPKKTAELLKDTFIANGLLAPEVSEGFLKPGAKQTKAKV
jgi:hypothetical protein